jgi:hypothetical protein
MSRLPNTVKSSPSLLLPLTPGLDNYAPSSLILLVSGAYAMVETLQPTGLALVILWPSLATVVVALRVYTRISMRQFFLGKMHPAQNTQERTAWLTVALCR